MHTNQSFGIWHDFSYVIYRVANMTKTRTSVSFGGLAVALVVLLLTAGHLIPFKEVNFSMCSISGSSRVVTRWFGLWSRVEVKTTPLEVWIRQREPMFRPKWKHYSTNKHRVLARSFGCSPKPPIYSLGPLMGYVTTDLSEERIAELVKVTRTATLEEQKDFVGKIADEILDSLDDRTEH